MQNKLKRLRGATSGLILAGICCAPAYAIPITGTLSLSDGFDSVNNIVSDLTFIDVRPIAQVDQATQDFSGLGPVATGDFDLTAPAGTVIYQLGDFTFTLGTVFAIETAPFECVNGACGDELRFRWSGEVAAAGYDTTAFVGNFTANATCIEAGESGRCNPSTLAPSWSSSIVALGEPVPTPGTIALIGLGLLGLGASRKRLTAR